MKKKDVISIIIITLVLAALIAGCVYLAYRHRIQQNDSKNKIIRSDYQIDGVFLYFDKNGTMMRYNTLNDSVQKLCGHAKRDSKCPLENLSNNIFLSDNKLYFSYRTEVLGNQHVAYYDIVGSEVHDLDIELGRQSNFCIYNGKIYYVSENTILCMSADGGTPSKLTECGENEDVLLAADGKIFTYTYFPYESAILYGNSYIYSYNIKTHKKTELYSFFTTVSYPISKAQYFDGTMFMIIARIDTDFDLISTSNSEIIEDVLLSIDTKKNKINFLYEPPIQDFVLTKESIYFFPYEKRYVNYVHLTQIMTTSERWGTECGESIYQCDHNCNNFKTAYTNSALAFESRYIVNGKLFGMFIGDCPELGIDADLFYGAIDLKTGKITKIEMP